MGRVVARLLAAGFAAAVVLAPTSAYGALKATVQASGSVSGEFTAGNVLTVQLKLTHSAGWQNFQSVEVALQIRGRPLDQLVLDTSELSLFIVGGGASASLTQPQKLHGTFFSVNTSGVDLHATGDTLELKVPVRLLIDPPPGARLYYTYAANGVPTVGFKPLTPPAEAKSGFSWGTLAVAIAAALFAGGFLGNLVASNRRRQTGPSIYATVARRLEEERARK